MKKVRVLYFVDRLLIGGIQTLIINWISKFDKSKIQVDFLLLDDGQEYELEQTLKDMGCNIYKLKDMWIRKPTDFIKYGNMLNNFFHNHHDYKAVHMHSSSKNYMVLKYAKKYNIPIRIAHSHNIGFQTKNPLKKLIGNTFKIPMNKYATHYFACSTPAGEWLFGKRITKTNKFKVIHNAVDLQKFNFNENTRNSIRKKLNIDNNTLVIGHAGRFTNQKNHNFLIEIFNEIHKINQNTKLLLIGTGEKETEIKEKVKQLKLNNNVIFAGFKNNVNEYMFAMDIFIFPSKYEGLGLVLIEAQATGMKCYTSKDVVPKEAQVSNLLEYISLDKTPNKWANIILNNNNIRENKYKEIKANGYDIQDTIQELEQFYLNM